MNKKKDLKFFGLLELKIELTIMYLEKLEIQGFKSFAGKNKLVFPGFVKGSKRGITAIVGPNGSGKSNVADAVRWALGEQSMKNLRAKAGEDIIFSGPKNKNKQNMAEVSLHLNNEDKRADIPYSELIISRRVYRNGENEYLINGSKSRLSDIQLLLARANVGQKTYSVIGQGMVESFLKTTPAERKDFFDEATGIKELQIKRETSLNKLINSHKNLEQAKMIVSEIEPRLKTLTRQVNKLQKKGELENELRDLQTKYFRVKWHYFNNNFVQFNRDYEELKKEKDKKEEELARKNQEFNKIQEQKSLSEDFSKWSVTISKLQEKREVLIKDLSSLEAKREASLEQKGKVDLSWLESQKKEIEAQIRENKQDLERISKEVQIKEEEFSMSEEAKKRSKEKVDKTNKELMDIFSSSPLEKENEQKEKVEEQLWKINELLKGLEDQKDESSIKKGLAAIKKKISDVINLISKKNEQKERDDRRRRQEELKKELAKWEKELEQEKRKQNEKWLSLNSKKEKRSGLEKERELLKNSLKNIEEKINKVNKKGSPKSQELLKKQEEERVEKEKELEKINKEIKKAKKEFDELTTKEEEKRSRLSVLQQESQVLQREISELNNQLSKTKIESTKFETKLEDLENEIKHSWVEDLEDIKEKSDSLNLDMKTAADRIEKIKGQLNLIGAIDPETEQEYYQSKEKYDFLTEQILDLKKAINSLEGIIKELDNTIKQKFDKEFKRISQKFEQYFKILFNGGSAKIIKIPYDQLPDEEDNKEAPDREDKIKSLSKYTSTGVAGIDIQVNPPGKKITFLSMLSGGEKALTAIALICAIISSNPSPFVVLDEVDAALDEANSQRLAKILEDLAHKTQFILVTHNRSSMHKANVLYGTTMDESGVSKFLSINLEQNNSIKKNKS